MRTTQAGPIHAFIHQLERLFHQGTMIILTEGELLKRFVASHDESSVRAHDRGAVRRS